MFSASHCISIYEFKPSYMVCPGPFKFFMFIPWESITWLQHGHTKTSKACAWLNWILSCLLFLVQFLIYHAIKTYYSYGKYSLGIPNFWSHLFSLLLSEKGFWAGQANWRYRAALVRSLHLITIQDGCCNLFDWLILLVNSKHQFNVDVH